MDGTFALMPTRCGPEPNFALWLVVRVGCPAPNDEDTGRMLGPVTRGCVLDDTERSGLRLWPTGGSLIGISLLDRLDETSAAGAARERQACAADRR